MVVKRRLGEQSNISGSVLGVVEIENERDRRRQDKSFQAQEGKLLEAQEDEIEVQERWDRIINNIWEEGRRKLQIVKEEKKANGMKEICI